MKKLFLTLVILLTTYGLKAQTLVFHLSDGTTCDVPITSTFTLTPSGENLIIASDGAVTILQKDKVLVVTSVVDPNGMKGDVNSDKRVDIGDIHTLINIIAGKDTDNGDNSGEGGTDVEDNAPDGAEAIDMGFPSGTKWANMNVGATSEVEYGHYFAWGETKGYTDAFSGERNFDWSYYKWCNGSSVKFLKYCTDANFGNLDNKTELDPEDDAAHVNWGGLWRMPTKEQVQELISYATRESTWRGGVKGFLFTSKTNGNSIFLPTAGVCNGKKVYQQGYEAHYWSSSLQSDNSYSGIQLRFDADGIWCDGSLRSQGVSVRAVQRK